MSHPAGNNGGSERQLRIDRLVEEVVRRRSGGEFLSDKDVVTGHGDLMPELGEQLRVLRKVERAETLAAEMGSAAGDSRDLIAIQGYHIERELYRGGQGIVYRARQLATGRLVAIKVMREGPFVGPRDTARFDREVRVLGRLRHPNIVRIYDSGATDGSRYFVMDYIEGQALDEFLASCKLDVDEILRLFIKICNAVNAAHLRGIIHRDLKPGNVRIDSSGEPHVLDFGLAKLVSGEGHEQSLWRHMTMTGQFIGSVHWASPEQAEGPVDAIDLRSDIYSLGVLLFHMLTGQFPYPVSGNMAEVVRHILQSEPRRPASIRRGLDEDVETIVLKCLAKEPDRRYQSVAALVEDVERYLARRPILARAPSTIYQIRKLMVRHKLPFAMLVLLFLLTATFAIWMSVLYEIAASDRTRAQEAEARAATEADSARAINDFLVNDMLAGAAPTRALGSTITVKEVLDAAAARIEGAFPEEPLVEAALRGAIGQSYVSLGLYPPAEVQLRAALATRADILGSEHPETLDSEYQLAGLLASMARYAEAELLSEHALQGMRRALGEEDRRTLSAYGLRAQLHSYRGQLEQSEVMWQGLLEKQQRLWGDEHPQTLGTLSNLAAVQLVRRKRSLEAEEVFREVHEACVRVLGASHPNTLGIMISLGQMLTSQRKFEEAELLFEQALDGHLRVLGEDHPSTLSLLHQLAFLRQAQGRLNEAITLRRTAVERGSRVLGPEHPLTLQALEALGHNLALKGAYAEALDTHRQTLAIHERIYGPEHAACAHSLDCMGKALGWLGRHSEAETRLRESYELLVRAPNRDEAAASPLRDLVAMLAAQGKPEEARPFAERLLETRRRAAEDPATDAYRLNCYARELLDVYPVDLRDPQLALSVALEAFDCSTDAYHYNRYTLARAYEANGDVENAIAMVRRALASIPLETSRERMLYENMLVRLLESADDPDAAEAVYRKILATRREQTPSNQSDIAGSLFDLGSLLVRHRKYAEAEPYLLECLEQWETLLDSPDSRSYRTTLGCNISNALLAVGRSLIGQQRYPDAEPRFLDAYDRLAKADGCHADLLPSTMRELVALYKTQGQLEQAVHYEKMLAESADE